VRRFWRGDAGQVPELASRLAGSADVFGPGGRRTYASVNFVTAHDGFTLEDLVSFEDKHNEANGEDNRDGTDDNRSWNCGAEGPTDDPEVNALRDRQKRNFLTTLFLSQGVPMLVGGDELGRTQGGNNNAFCQDNEISWFDWGSVDGELLDFTRSLIEFRAAHPTFRRRAFFTGGSPRGSGLPDLWWFRPDGRKMTQRDWGRGEAKTIGVFLNGDELPRHSVRGEDMSDDSFMLLFNGHYEPIAFTLPTRRFGLRWTVDLNTADGHFGDGGAVVAAREPITVESRSIVVLRRTG
jgi:glycogen operon protein